MTDAPPASGRLKKSTGAFERSFHGIYQTTPGGEFITANPATAATLLRKVRAVLDT